MVRAKKYIAPINNPREYKLYNQATQAIHTMLDECANNMISVGIPIQKDKILDIVLATISGAQAVCWFKNSDDTNFIIGIRKQMMNYLDDMEVMSNVKNSIYHELLHTIKGASSHNEIFKKWSEICDELLYTRVNQCMENAVFYHTSKRTTYQYTCPNCGFSYISTKNNLECTCSGCGRIIKNAKK